MNWVEWHLKDYAEATDHLNFLEDCAYFRMLRKYYADERPLPRQVAKVQRLVRANTKDEKRAVKKVLREFFELSNDGWRQKRCDYLIARYQSGEPERDGRRTKENERKHRYREERERLFSQLRELGVHPPWNAKSSDLRVMLARQTGTTTGTATETPRTASQEPITNNHQPSERESSNVADATTPSQSRGKNGRAKETEGSGAGWTYFPDTFDLTSERREVAERIGIRPEDIEPALAKFCRYYRSSTGKEARSRDWESRWELWCQRQLEDHAREPDSPAAPNSRRMSSLERWAARKEANENA